MTQSGGTLNKEVFLLDTKTYTWITSFQANSSTSSSSSSTPISSTPTSSTPPTGVIIGASIGGSLVIIVSGIAIAFFILKHRKHTAITDYNKMRTNSGQDIIEIPSSTD